MLKKLLIISIVLLVGFISLYCLSSFTNSNSKKEVVSFSSWGSVSETAILKRVIAEFELDNPDIKINFIHIPQNYFAKLHLLFASNTAPDVVFINNLNLPVYENYLEDLDNIIFEDEFYSQSIDGLSYNGKLKAVPRDISNLVFYVNLDKLKLPPEDWTLDEFLKTLQQAEGFVISYEEDIYWVMPYLWAFNGGVLDSEGNLIINSKESQKGLAFYKDLRDKYKLAPTKSQVGSSTLAQMFLDEKIAIYLSGRWMYPKISEKANFNWAVINFPYGEIEGTKLLTLTPCDVSGWAISKSSKHRKSAEKFVKYLSSAKTSEYFTQTGLIVPARIEVAKKLNNKEHNEKVFLEVIKTSASTPVNKDYKKLTDEINKKYFN